MVVSEHHQRNPPNVLVLCDTGNGPRHRMSGQGAPRFSGTGSPAVCPYLQPSPKRPTLAMVVVSRCARFVWSSMTPLV